VAHLRDDLVDPRLRRDAGGEPQLHDPRPDSAGSLPGCSDAAETEPREQRQPHRETAERHHGQRRDYPDEGVPACVAVIGHY